MTVRQTTLLLLVLVAGALFLAIVILGPNPFVSGKIFALCVALSLFAAAVIVGGAIAVYGPAKIHRRS